MQDGDKVWAVTVSPVLTAGGLWLEVHEGTVASISTGHFVRYGAHCSYDMTIWRETKAQALEEAAQTIERFIAPAVVQVAKLRKEAASEAVASV